MEALRNSLILRCRPYIFTSTAARRFVSVQCRGKQITKEEVFKYTNGRFLKNESEELSKRSMSFNLDNLCDLVASLDRRHHSAVSKIDKAEGGFSKALLMTRENGTQCIVKVPCPNAGRPKYCTASEVGTLEFVRARTSIPVPKVIAWSSEKENMIGAEYIVMEMIPGVQIFKTWDEMSESKRIFFIKRLTQWEKELASIRFPAYGSLYHKMSVDHREVVPLDKSIDPSGEFCVGPACDASWTDLFGYGPLRQKTCGPWKTLGKFGESLIERALLRAEEIAPGIPDLLQGSVGERISLLRRAKKPIQLIANDPNLLQNSQPTLWHTDLHMGNIFVSENDPGQVTGIIDWQHTSIGPLFLQARYPVFLTPPDDYQEGPDLPQLPENSEQLDEDDKELALYNKSKATWTKAYEVATFLNNRSAWAAMQVPSAAKELFRRYGEIPNEGILPLREDLIRIFLDSKDSELATELGFHFTDAQVARHRQEFKSYQEWHEMRTFVKTMLDTDEDGWIAPERDFEEIKSRNKLLFDHYVSKIGSTKTRDQITEMWPFPEYL